MPSKRWLVRDRHRGALAVVKSDLRCAGPVSSRAELAALVAQAGAPNDSPYAPAVTPVSTWLKIFDMTSRGTPTPTTTLARCATPGNSALERSTIRSIAFYA